MASCFPARIKDAVVVALLCISLRMTKTDAALQIGPLLSTCVDSCQRGCIEIRSVQASRKNKALAVELKDKDNPRSALTEADGAAQRAIIGSLRSVWGKNLRIVGEEDDDEESTAAMEGMTFEPPRKDIFDDDFGETAEIDMSDVTIFVDPLDGTREFVEGRLENCQVLVGIAIGGEAVAGAIGIPFPAGDDSTEPTIVYGLADVGTGVMGAPLTRGPYPLDRNIDGVKYPRPHIATGDSTADVMIACKESAIKATGGSNVIYGGAGNKILAAALGEVAGSMSIKFGGPWDLCAPHAIITAMGGRITDLFGDEISLYEPDSITKYRRNERGFVATPRRSDIDHDALVAALNRAPSVQKYKDSIN